MAVTASQQPYRLRGSFLVGDTTFRVVQRDGSACSWLLIGESGPILGTVDNTGPRPELRMFEMFEQWDRPDLRDQILNGVARIGASDV